MDCQPSPEFGRGFPDARQAFDRFYAHRARLLSARVRRSEVVPERSAHVVLDGPFRVAEVHMHVLQRFGASGVCCELLYCVFVRPHAWVVGDRRVQGQVVS